jgi:hypothetical protein
VNWVDVGECLATNTSTFRTMVPLEELVWV